MKLKIPLNYLLAIGLTLIGINSASAADDDHFMTSEKTIKQEPIVIHTQVPNYNQPTLTEYMKCHENLDNCMRVCETASNRTACESECPTCPILINQDVVVQGINDTYIRIPITTPLNTTNIIRLTNEIRNIIDNKMGNVTARNENTVHVHQSNSTSGGRFGLGYNKRGSCCIVVRSSTNCDKRQFSTAQKCHHKRSRVCGERCKSRVMIAKRVKRCGADGANCSTGFAYETAHRCRSTQFWPYVRCGDTAQRSRRNNNCWRCLQLPYVQILQYGVSPSCMRCYRRYSNDETPLNDYDDWQFTNSYYPAAPPRRPLPPYNTYEPEDDYNDDYDDWMNKPLNSDNGWKVEKTKCRHPDGSIIEDCIENSEDLPEHSGDDINNFSNDNYDLEPNNDLFTEDGFNDIYARRRRRSAFRRSKYSQRYGNYQF